MTSLRRLVKVHAFDVRGFNGSSHRSSRPGMDGPYAPGLTVVLHQVGAGEGRFLRDNDDVGVEFCLG